MFTYLWWLLLGTFLYLTQIVFTFHYDPDFVAYNLNTNRTAHSPINFWGERKGHKYTPSPTNWRFPFYTLLMDRFVDGDPFNNDINGTHFERDTRSTQFRHGGDVQGLIDTLDYLEGMGIKGLYIAGSIFQNLPWTYDSYSPVDLTLLDPHFGTLALWQTAIDEIHKRGMYVILDNTFATLGDLLGAEGYLNVSVPFSPKEHTAIYKTDRVYHDFIFDNSWNEDCQYPRFWNETGFPVDEEVVNSFKGCRNSDFDQYGDTEAFGIYPDYRRQLTKFASVQDRVREWKPSVRAKLENFFCIVIAQLDIDGYRYDKAMQATVDALGEMNKGMRKCAARHGKKNFFLPGEITGGNNLASIYLGRGRQPDMLPPNLNVAIQAGHSTQSYSIRNADQAGNDAAAFHYTVYRTLTRHLLMDGNLEAGYDAPANFVDMWNTFLLTNDFTNPNTGEFDPRHMYGTMNQDVFRWPAIKDGIRKQLLGNFITTLLLPGIPLLLWGEEQSFYTLDNTASNYIFGRQPMSAAGAWQTHGCYSLDSTQYYQFPVESARNGCKDEKVSYDHRDVSSPIRNIFKHFYFLRSQFTVLQDGAWLQQLSNQTWQSILPGSSGVPTEQGLWSVMRSDIPGVNLLNGTTNSLTSVWLLWTNIESTKSFYFNCSDTRISPQTQALLSPFPASTRLRNLLHPYEIVDLQESEQVLGTFNSTLNRTNGCLPFLEMHSFDFKAFVPIEEWEMPPATVTGFYLNGDQRNGHDSRILAKEENPQIGETISVTILFSRFIDCGSVTKRLQFTSSTVSGRLPKLIKNTVQCQAQMIPTTSQHLQNAAPTEWSWSGQLSGVEHGIHRISINATGSIDKFTFRIGTKNNPVIFPRIANYSTSLVRSETLVSGNKVITLAHNADGADLWRYTSNWGSSYSDWMPYSGGDTNITLLDWNGTKEQAWKGTHIRVEYYNRIVGSSDMIQEGDLEKEVGMKRFPHLYWNGPYNDYGFDASINNEVQYRSEDKVWYYKFMNEWPAIGQFNVWGTNPDGLPDQTYVMGDIDGDMVLDRLPPSSLSSIYINITQSPDMMHPAWALHIDDATMKFYLQPTGSSLIQMIIFSLFSLIPFISAFLAVLAFIKSFYKVKFNQLGSTLQEKVSTPPALQRIYNCLQPSKRIILSDSGFSSRSRSGSLNKDKESYDQSEQQRKRTTLIATIEYDIEDWNIKVKIGGMGVMAQLMGKALGHQNLIWVVPCIGDVHFPIDTPAEPMRVTILGVDYSIQVQYHFLNNVTYVLLDAPIFRQQTKAEPYPTRMDDINSAIYYSAWNQCIAHTARRFPIDLYHINDYHGCLAPLYLLPQTIPCCFSLHNAEFQGLWPMRTTAECEEVCRVFNLTIEIVRKYVQFGEIFNLLHAGASYLRIHQRGFGAVGVSKKYGSRVHLRYPIFWGLQKVGHLPNPDPTDVGEWKGSTSLQEPICIQEEFENKRPLLREEAQRWAGLEVDSNAELFVFVGRWSVQKGVDLIADVFPKILKQHSNVQLICVGPIIDLYGRFAALKLDHLMKQYPKRVCSKPVFTALPPCVFAGAEFALIPSRDEPFGLVAVEFGRKGALGVGARVGGLGNMPGWWYTVEAMSTSHLLRQFQQAIEEALSCKKHIRALMRARAAKQRFPVAQWLEDLEILQSNSIRIHEKCGGKLLNQIQDSQNQIQYPITSSNVVEDSYNNNDLESNLPIPSRLFVSNIKRKPPPAVPSIFSPLRLQNERDIECSSQISDEDFFEALEEEESNNDRFDYETQDRKPAIETKLVRETLFGASSSTDILPAGITDGSLESSRLDSSNSLIKYTDDTETPAIEEEIAFLPQLTSYRSSANLLDANAVLGDSARRNAYLLQNVDAQFTDPDDLYFSRFSRKLDQASSSPAIKASSTCIEEFLIDSEREWFAETLKAKLNLGAIGRPFSSLSTEKSFSRRNSDCERTGRWSRQDDRSESTQVSERKTGRFQGILFKYVQMRVGDWPVYSLILALGQIMAANSYQITLLAGQIGQKAEQLYVLCSIYILSTMIYWLLFRKIQLNILLSIPFILYSFAFLSIGLAHYGISIEERGWIQSIATGLYAAASASGSLYFSLNFGDEGGSPVRRWIFRACLLQGLQQIYICALWYWGSNLVKNYTIHPNSDLQVQSVTYFCIPICVSLWVFAFLIFYGLSDYYRRKPGSIPSFYKTVIRRKVIMWFFLMVIVQNFFLSTQTGRNWSFLWSSKHTPSWQIALLAIFFFIFLWIAIMSGFSILSKSHSWLLPIIAAGLGAPRWAQIWWAVSGMALWLPWTGSYIASGLVARSLWLWLGLLDTVQSVGVGMALLATMTRFHVTFTLMTAQILGALMTVIARACAPDALQSGSVFPNLVLEGFSGIQNAWFWIALVLNTTVCSGFFLFYRREQLSKP
ncbi:alpha-1,3-glucan synthase [Meira miltonrushii]|uniref:alpha-1,3-glucan synthase n=1 Tax=Meira miltonrushii TaxID=1280837 RepID=A0A316V0Z2_9BASI|nr:alpha-1,3-glucan synthase [Meira miltonrushii]PWN31216.1 alpha-1,3-glucan synthase [Meira miltonrushii]